MEEQVEQETREEKIRARQAQLKNNISPRITEIRSLLDSLSAIIGKEVFQDAELEEVFDVMDAIREESDKIEELLFDLRDTVR